VTTSNGYSTYLFQSIPKGAYTIRPSKPGYTFTPSYRAVTGTESEWILHRQNFTATKSPSEPVLPFYIGGTITGVEHATVTLTGPTSRVTTSNGYSTYLFQSIPKGAYTIRPSKPGYTFTPRYRAVTGTESEWILHRQNFTATKGPPKPIHSATLSWKASPSKVLGYRVHRGTVPGGPYVQIAIVHGLTYVDRAVLAGGIYYYVVTSYTSSTESVYSNEVKVGIPKP
jgi:hypothetical protein